MSSEAMNFNNPFRRALTETPLIEAGALDAAILAVRSIDIKLAEHPALKRIRSQFEPEVSVNNGVATIPIKGVLMRNPDLLELAYLGAEDSSVIERLIDSCASNPDVTSILLDIDSPGGYSIGIAEIGDAVRNAAKTKPVVAFTGGLMCSAAYWIASQASQIVATRSSKVGSIGVYAAFTDYSARLAAFGIKVEVFTNKEGTYKAAGAQGTSLTDDQRKLIQSQVQEDFDEFKAAVLKKRPGVPAEAMRGQTFAGRKAEAVGLVDHTGTIGFAYLTARRMAKKA